VAGSLPVPAAPNRANDFDLGQIILQVPENKKTSADDLAEVWLRRVGSNHRPSGYEPDELPLLYFAMWTAKLLPINLPTK
jgi:hypothetical protein